MQRYEIFLAPPNTIASNFYEISRLDYVDYVKRICTHTDSKCPLNSYSKILNMLKFQNVMKSALKSDTNPTWRTPFGPHCEVAAVGRLTVSQFIEI